MPKVYLRVKRLMASVGESTEKYVSLRPVSPYSESSSGSRYQPAIAKLSTVDVQPKPNATPWFPKAHAVEEEPAKRWYFGHWPLRSWNSTRV